MARPATLPEAESYQHGTRARYVTGCRCKACTFANTRRYHEREAISKEIASRLPRRATSPIAKTWTRPDGSSGVRIYKRSCAGIKGEPCPFATHLRKDSSGDICGRCRARLIWDGTVDAGPARTHIRRMSRRGVGYKTLADAAKVSITVVHLIKSGKKATIRRNTEEKILAVDDSARAGGAIISAGPTQRLLKELLERGFTKTWLAQQLGSKSRRPALQYKFQHVEARVARAVEKLNWRLRHESPPKLKRWPSTIETCSCSKPIVFERNENVYCAKCDMPLRRKKGQHERSTENGGPPGVGHSHRARNPV